MSAHPTSLPRKEREHLVRRREILLAARKIFAEKGYEPATVEEIAAEAEFTKGSLYNYFLNKEEMFIALLEESFNDFESMIHSAFENDLPLREQFRRFAYNALNYFSRNPEFLTILMKENLQMKIKYLHAFRERFAERRQRLCEKAAQRMETDIKAGRIKSINPIKLVEIFWEMIFFYLLHSQFNSEEIQLETWADEIISIFFDGVSTK